ncbi:MAG: site-specific integrase [Actinomycetota bacterium]|nr:site-specific integrase [Actinomycetota bacterium]
MARTYPDPFVPNTFSCWIRKGRTVEQAVDRSTGQRVKRPVDCWDLEGRADGIQWIKRFPRAGLAQTWKEQIERDFAAGLHFDLRSKRFVVPQQPEGPRPPTVFELTETFYRSHPEWEPTTKRSAATSFNRARRWLLAPGVELRAPDLAAVEDYLDHASFLPAHLEAQMTPTQVTGRDWLQKHSASCDGLTTMQIEAFVTRFQVNQRDPNKRVGATTIVRFLQPLKSCWAWAVARDDILVERNPFGALRPRRKVKGKTSASSGRIALAVDADLVLDIPQSLALATACASEGSWGGVVECFVLVMALSGLRPGEAVGLQWDDIELPAQAGPGWLTVRRSHRKVAGRWMDPDEDPEWGPLKDRDIVDKRRVPIPPLLVERLREHRRLFGDGPDGLVFCRNGKPFQMDLFARNVWEPGRAALFPARAELAASDPRQPKLSRLRRHDLRHAACSWWLREGVDAVVCQRWSGHKTLSVFLDIYQGVAPGREDEGVRKLTASLPA